MAWRGYTVFGGLGASGATASIAITTPIPIPDRDVPGVGVLGELQELPGDQASRVGDDVAIHLVDLVGAMRVAQDVAGDRATVSYRRTL